MASQPLNTQIQVFRRIRAQREPQRHDSIKNITHKLRRLILVDPHNEIRTGVVSRDSAVTDFSTYMGQAKSIPAAQRGMPVVIGVVARKDFTVVQQLAGIDFPVEIGHDKFVQETAATVGGDLHQAGRDTTEPVPLSRL
jgi:hypothetical protein